MGPAKVYILHMDSTNTQLAIKNNNIVMSLPILN